MAEKKDWPFLLVRVFCGAAAISLNFISLSYLPLGDAGVIFATTPTFTTILGWIFLKEKCRFSDLVVLFFTLLGVFFIIRPPLIFKLLFPDLISQESTELSVYNRVIGCSIALCGAFIQSGVFISLRRLRGVNYATISFIYSLVSSPVLFLIVLIMGELTIPPTYEYRLLVLLISFTATAAHALMTIAAKFIPAGMVSLTRSAECAFGFIWQVIFLGKEVNAFSICGCALVACSIAFISLRSYLLDRYTKTDDEPNCFVKGFLILSK